MAFSNYLHGVEVDERVDGAPSIAPIRTSVIGIVGTAVQGEDNEPVLLKTPREAAEAFGSISASKEAYEAAELEVKKLQAQADAAGDTVPEELAAKLQEAETARDEVKKTYDDIKSTTLPRALEAINFQTSPLIVAVKISGDSASNAMGDAAQGTGLYALLKAQTKLGYTPKVILAPTFASDTGVQTALFNVSDKLRAVSIIEGTMNNTSAEVKAAADNQGSSRYYLGHPWVEGEGNVGDMPLSPFIAGLVARNDGENGFWSNPSNKEIKGIKKLKQDIEWSLSDPNSEANLLNEKGVATVIRHNGWRLWGARTLGKGNKKDDANKFLNVRRITDTINDSIAKSTIWAVDEDIIKNYIQDVLESVNNYLRNLRRDGAIVNGTAWVDPEENPPENIKEGKVIFSFDYSPVYPGEQVKFKSILTDKYLTEVFE